MSTLFVSIRLDEATMARVDALVPQFSSEWRKATRSDVLRALIVVALGRYEREVASPRLRPGPRGVPRGGGGEAAPESVRAPRRKADAASRSAPSAAKETPASRKRKRAKKGERPSKGKG